MTEKPPVGSLVTHIHVPGTVYRVTGPGRGPTRMETHVWVEYESGHRQYSLDSFNAALGNLALVNPYEGLEIGPDHEEANSDAR